MRPFRGGWASKGSVITLPSTMHPGVLSGRGGVPEGASGPGAGPAKEEETQGSKLRSKAESS